MTYQNHVPITDTLLADHRITNDELAAIERHLGRTPTFTELGVFSVMWSEHCSYKSSRVHLKKFPTTGPRVIQGPGENAGVVDIGEGLAAVFKMESHNHPSFIEPYQGAATGVGGILRDIFTMGARPVASLNSLRFGDPSHPKTPFLVSGVVAGIAGYGNAIGVPTVGGEVYFDPSYNGNILVNVFNLGVVEQDKIFLGRAAGPGNLVVYVGSRTGRDGIHGATMASGTFEEDSESKRPTVQVGDPFTEKRLLEACLELFRAGCLVGIQDMGAAGLTSSSVEMAGRAGTGLLLHLDRIPMRETGMTPYEILLSESQERMLVVIEPRDEAELKDIFDKWDLEATVVGNVTESGHWVATWHGEVVADIPVDALTDAAPVYRRPYAPPADLSTWQHLPEVPAPPSGGEILRKLVGSPTIASKRWIAEQYDSMVRTDTVAGFGSDAAVIRVKGTKKGLAMTVDCNSSLCQLDPRRGAGHAVAESVRNLACVGAEPIGLTDCLNFGSPERPEIMWQFVEAIEGLADACRALEVPVISGNVSLYNETEGTAIQPTPTVAVVGLLEDVTRTCTPTFKGEGHLIALLGEVGQEVGGSEYLKEVFGIRRGRPPAVDFGRERAVAGACRELVREGLLRSAHDCAEGGLAVALLESCFGGEQHKPVGARIDGLGLEPTPQPGRPRWDFALFGESAGRIVVSFEEADREKVRAVAERFGAPFSILGVTGGDRLEIEGILNEPRQELGTIYQGALVERVFNRR